MRRKTLLSFQEKEVDRVMGDRVRSLRRKEGMSSSVLAEKLGICVTHLHKKERGEVIMGVSFLWQICRIFDKDLMYFFEGCGPPPPKPREFFNVWYGGPPEKADVFYELVTRFNEPNSKPFIRVRSSAMDPDMGSKGIPDLIFMDINHSLLFLKEMRTRDNFKKIPIIILKEFEESSYDSDLIKDAYREGCAGVIFYGPDVLKEKGYLYEKASKASPSKELFKKKIHEAITYWCDVSLSPSQA